MCYTDDPIFDYDCHCAEQQRLMDRLPKCDYCDSPIMDDDCFEINGDILCEECLDRQFKRRVEDYVE